MEFSNIDRLAERLPPGLGEEEEQDVSGCARLTCDLNHMGA